MNNEKHSTAWVPMVLLMQKMAPTPAHDSQTCLDAVELLLSLPAGAGASLLSTLDYFHFVSVFSKQHV